MNISPAKLISSKKISNPISYIFYRYKCGEENPNWIQYIKFSNWPATDHMFESLPFITWTTTGWSNNKNKIPCSYIQHPAGLLWLSLLSPLQFIHRLSMYFQLSLYFLNPFPILLKHSHFSQNCELYLKKRKQMKMKIYFLFVHPTGQDRNMECIECF